MKPVRNADVISHPENGVTLVHMPKCATYISIKDIQDTIYCNAENHNKEDRTSGILKWFNGKHCSLMLVCLFFKKSVKLAVLLKKAFIGIIILHYPPNPSWGGRVKGQKARVSSFAKEGSQRIKRAFYLWATRGFLGFPGGLAVKNPPANARDMGSIPGSGRSPGEGNGNPLQYSCLKNAMDREAWWPTVHGVEKSRTQLREWATRGFLSSRWHFQGAKFWRCLGCHEICSSNKIHHFHLPVTHSPTYLFTYLCIYYVLSNLRNLGIHS